MSNNFLQFTPQRAQGQQQISDQNKRLEKFQMFCRSKAADLQNIMKTLQLQTANIEKSLDEWKLHVSVKVEGVQLEIQKILEKSGYLTLNEIQNEQIKLLESINQLREDLKSYLINISLILQINQLFQFLDALAINLMEQKKQLLQSQKMESKEGISFNYEILEKSSYSQDSQCGVIAINKENKLIIEGFDNQINVLKFENETLEPIQHLSDHSAFVSCLRFLQKSKQFISASYDSNIILWEENQQKKYKKWYNKQILNGHKSQVICLEINKNEDILISGSSDKTIKFWKNIQDKWSLYEQIDCQYQVYSLSLNDSNDQLIAGISYNEILLIQQKGQKWIIEQRIPIEQHGLRLSFIGNNQFILQPRDRNYLQIFTFNNELKIYEQQENIQYEFDGSKYCTIFPIKFIQVLGLILVKNGSYLYILRKNKKGKLEVQQAIDFETTVLYGCMSDDGQYIFTWDNKSFNIQIRKLVIE